MKVSIIDLFLPRETHFFVLLRKQIGNVYVASGHLHSLVSRVSSLSEDEIKEMVDCIRECERKGNEISWRIVDKLHTSFITPLDREDIYELVSDVDYALDMVYSVSQKVAMYKIRKVPKNVVRFARIIVEMASQIKQLVVFLEKNDGIRDVQVCVMNVQRLEIEADALFHESMVDLFESEKNVVNIIKLKEVYGHFESTVNSFEMIANLIRGVVVKQG